MGNGFLFSQVRTDPMTNPRYGGGFSLPCLRGFPESQGVCYALLMTTNEVTKLTAKQYATAYGFSLATAYRKIHARKAWNLARKELRNGRRVWLVLLSRAEVRALKAALVDRDRRAGHQIKALGKKFGFAADLSAPRALRTSARDSLVAIGAADLIIALDAARISPKREHLARIDNLIAA